MKHTVKHKVPQSKMAPEQDGKCGGMRKSSVRKMAKRKMSRKKG